MDAPWPPLASLDVALVLNSSWASPRRCPVAADLLNIQLLLLPSATTRAALLLDATLLALLLGAAATCSYVMLLQLLMLLLKSETEATLATLFTTSKPAANQ